jgi:hypothetical protein
MTAAEVMQTCNQKEGPVMNEAIAEDTRRATSEIDVVPPEMFGFNQYSHRPRKDRHRKHETASQTGDRPAKPNRGNGITATQGLWLKMVTHVVQSRVVENEVPSVLPENDPEPTPIISNSKSSNDIPFNVEVPTKKRRLELQRVMSEITLNPSQHPGPARPHDIVILPRSDHSKMVSRRGKIPSFNVEVPKKKRRIVLQRVMSEITLNPSQHPAPARHHDIVILPRSDHSKMVSRRGKIPSHRPLPSILGGLYPDYASDNTSLQLDDIAGEGCTHQNDDNGAINRSQTTLDKTLPPTSLRHDSLSSLPSMDEIPPLPFADGDDQEMKASETRDSFLFQLSRRQLVSGMKQFSLTLPKGTPRKSRTFHMPSFKSFSVRRLWSSKVGDGTVVSSA